MDFQQPGRVIPWLKNGRTMVVRRWYDGGTTVVRRYDGTDENAKSDVDCGTKTVVKIPLHMIENNGIVET